MEKIDPALLQRLDALAQKLNVTTQYLWAVLVKQAVISGYESLGICVISALFLIGFTALTWYLLATYRPEPPHRYRYERDPYERDPYERDSETEEAGRHTWLLDFDQAGCFIYWVLVPVLAIFSVAAICCSFPEALNDLLNPQYFALQQLFSLLK